MCLFPYIALTYKLRPYGQTYLNTMDLLGASMATVLALSGLVMFGGYDTQIGDFPVRVTLLASAFYLQGNECLVNDQ